MHGQTQDINVVTIVAWAGVGKSALVNHWLDGWLPNIIVLRSSFLAWSFGQGSSGDTSSADAIFYTLLSLGLEIPIQELERRVRGAKDWRTSSRIVEPYWFWTAWSRSKIRLVRKKGGYASLHSRRFCASSLPSIPGFAWSLRGLPISDIADRQPASLLRRDLHPWRRWPRSRYTHQNLVNRVV